MWISLRDPQDSAASVEIPVYRLLYDLQPSAQVPTYNRTLFYHLHSTNYHSLKLISYSHLLATAVCYSTKHSLILFTTSQLRVHITSVIKIDCCWVPCPFPLGS
jgi:hypothetical protein